MAVSLEREQLNADNIEHHLSNVVKDVRAKRLDLVNFVEELGPQLTDTDVEKRGYGVRFLSDVLHRLVGYPMQEKEVALFAEFLCDRLKDHYSITPVALFGILALVTNQRVAEADVVKIVQIIFKEVHIQSMLKEGRLTVFNLFAVLMDKNLKALTTLGNDFVFGFIQAVDGEKDPQNLLLVFRLVRIIITNFTIDLFAEDLFEVSSCYFPIDFTPPSNDPYGIKKEDLVSSLRKCLAATNQFAPFCLPLLMEKLSSDIVDAKIDSLLTLSACLEVYHSRYLLEHLDEIWTAVKTAVFHSVNFDLEEASLRAVTSVVRNLCGSMEENSQEKYEGFLETIQKDCVHFNGSDVRLMKPRGQLLQAAALAAEPACKKLIDCTFPLLLEQLKQNIETSHKKVLISITGDLLKAAKTFHTPAQDSPVVKYKDSLCGSLFSLLSDVNSSLCCTAVDCLMTLVDLTGLMADKEVELLVEHLTSIVLSNRETSVSQTSTACLAQLSRKYPSIVISKVLPSLLGQLGKEDGSAMVIDSNHPQSTPVSHQCVLGTLGAVCTEASVVCEVIPRLITHTQHLYEVGNTCDGVKIKTNSVLRCLLGIVEGSIERGLVSAAHFKQSVIPALMEMVLRSASNGSSDEGDVMQAAEVLDSVAAILRVVSRDLDIESAQSLQEEFARMFLEGKSTYWAALPDRTFSPLEVTSPWKQTQLVSLLTAALCSAKREVLTPRQSELVPNLQRLACHCVHERSAVSGAQCFAGIINKIPDGDQLTALLNDLISRIWQVTNEEGSLKRATVTWLWLTKAVVIRSHRLAPTFLEKVLSLLEDESVGRLAADGFYIIMADFEEVMNVKMHVNYRLMYRQRLFMETAPKLIEGFHSAKPAFKHHYLCALSHILQWIPKQVLLSEVPNLMPLLVHSLSCEEQSLKLSTLQTIYSLVLDAPEIITRHVTSLVPMLLGLSKFQPLMKIRVESLKCLGAMTTLPHHVVYPYKTKVCRALCDSVDDKKRIVRREAVKCRNEWFLLGSSAR